MPLTEEQKAHLQRSWQNIQLCANDIAAKNQIELLSRAYAKKNSAAIPGAYSEAELYRLETTVRDQLVWTVNEIDAMGVLVDDQVEKFLIQHFDMMTSMNMPIHFPPALIPSMNLSAHRGAHTRVRLRLNNKLQREAASAIRSLKLKVRPNIQMPTVVVHNQFNNSPGARGYVNSIDNSVNYIQLPPDTAALIATLSAGHPDLEELANGIHESRDKTSLLDKIARWVAAVSSIETLTEKLRIALPVIEGWIRHLS